MSATFSVLAPPSPSSSHFHGVFMTNNTPSGAKKHRKSTEPRSRQTAKMFFFFFFFFFFRRASSNRESFTMVFAQNSTHTNTYTHTHQHTHLLCGPCNLLTPPHHPRDVISWVVPQTQPATPAMPITTTKGVLQHAIITLQGISEAGQLCSTQQRPASCKETAHVNPHLFLNNSIPCKAAR